MGDAMRAPSRALAADASCARQPRRAHWQSPARSHSLALSSRPVCGCARSDLRSCAWSEIGARRHSSMHHLVLQPGAMRSVAGRVITLLRSSLGSALLRLDLDLIASRATRACSSSPPRSRVKHRTAPTRSVRRHARGRSRCAGDHRGAAAATRRLQLTRAVCARSLAVIAAPCSLPAG